MEKLGVGGARTVKIQTQLHIWWQRVSCERDHIADNSSAEQCAFLKATSLVSSGPNEISEQHMNHSARGNEEIRQLMGKNIRLV